MTSIESTHFTILASDLDALPNGWHAVGERTVVTLSRTEDPRVEPL